MKVTKMNCPYCDSPARLVKSKRTLIVAEKDLGNEFYGEDCLKCYADNIKEFGCNRTHSFYAKIRKAHPWDESCPGEQNEAIEEDEQ